MAHGEALKQAIRIATDKRTELDSTCSYQTEGMRRFMWHAPCHATFHGCVKRGATWHVEYIYRKSPSDQRQQLRWVKLLLNPDQSPYPRLAKVIKSDPIFKLNKHCFVFDPSRCLEAGFSAKYLVNFMCVLRAPWESSYAFKALKHLRRNDVYTVLTVCFARTGFLKNTFHDPFENRTHGRIQRFVNGDGREKCNKSSYVFYRPEDGPEWDRPPDGAKIHKGRYGNFAPFGNPASTQAIRKYFRRRYPRA